MTNEKNLGCLSQLCVDHNKRVAIIRIPSKQPVQWKVRVFFLWLIWAPTLLYNNIAGRKIHLIFMVFIRTDRDLP